MPELAEVEFYRKQWLPARGAPILEVFSNVRARVFRDCPPKAIDLHLPGSHLVDGFAHGKRLLFEFSNGNWLGIHLGMSGKLRLLPKDHLPQKHDHLVLRADSHCLVFHDPRMFGCITHDRGEEVPLWWRELPPQVLSASFSPDRIASFAKRLRRSPLKALLLDQRCFPGIGNWMADEICWRIRLPPSMPSGELTAAQLRALWKACRQVSRDALKIIGDGWNTPPAGWLFNHRWRDGGTCPRKNCRSPLSRSVLGGRTSCWCPHCQSV